MSALPHQEFLFTTAEVAAAFVGFSLVVSLFSPRSSSEAVRAVSLRDVAEISLVGVAGSLVPYVLFQFQVAADTLWRFSSLFLAVTWIVGFLFGSRRFRQAGGGSPLEVAPGFIRVTGLIAMGGSALLWWNVAVPSSFSSARYLLALLLLLTMAGCIFVFAAFHGAAPGETE